MIFGRLISLLLLLLLIFLMSVDVQASELDTDEYKEVQAVEILEQIRNGEDVNLSKCRIVGAVSLETIEVPETVPNSRKVTSVPSEQMLKVVESRISIQDSIFEDDVDFSGAFFRNSISFEGTYFSSKSDFTSVDFNNIADFRGAFFNDTVYFFGTDFIGNAYFGGARGVSSVLSPGSGAVFTKSAEFTQARFWNEAHFHFASFNEANFVDSNFENAYFIFSNFDGETHFEGSNFNNTAYFCNSTFDNVAEFRSSSFKNAYIYNSKFREINFLDTKFKTISLNNTSFERIKVRWDSLGNSLVFDGPTYVELIQNFRNLEQFEDADAAYYKYRSERQALKSWFSFSKWEDIFMCFTCGYGVKPFKTLFAGSVVVLLFSLFYLRWNGISLLTKNNEESNQKATLSDALYFSAVTFTTFGNNDWHPKENFRKWAMLERLLGWLTLSLFLVTLTRVMIRP